jgi:hypothetical protein
MRLGAKGLVAAALTAGAFLSPVAALASPVSVAPAATKVSTEPSDLLDFVGLAESQEIDFEGIKEFLTCFVSELDLPQEVYVACAMGVVSTARACQDAVMTPACISSAVGTAQKCALPVRDTIDGARLCMAAPVSVIE